MSYIGLKYKHILILIVLILNIDNFVSPTYVLRKRQASPPPPPGPCNDCLIKCCTDFCPAGGTCSGGDPTYDACETACSTGACGPINYDFSICPIPPTPPPTPIPTSSSIPSSSPPPETTSPSSPPDLGPSPPTGAL